MKEASSLFATMAHLCEHRVADNSERAGRGDGVENGSYAIDATRRPRPAGRRPHDTASIPGKSSLLARDTHADARSQRHVVLDERFDAPLADRPLPIEELDDVSMTFFCREVDGAFLIFVDRVESRLRGCYGVH